MIVCLNGSFLPAGEAHVSPFDRGFMLGDGVYEALRAFDGRIVAGGAHVQRLAASLAATRIGGFDPNQIIPLSRELLEHNGLRDAFLYWQITRGVSIPRAHLPQDGITPTVFGFAVPSASLDEINAPAALRVVTHRDERWLRCDIKSISLLPTVLAKITAADRGADEAILIRRDESDASAGYVTEAGSTNVFFVFDRAGKPEIATPPVSNVMLQGITRDLVLRMEPAIIERTIRADEISEARELILTGTSTFVASIIEVDGHAVGDGSVGPVARRLFAKLKDTTRAGADAQLEYRSWPT